MTIQEKAQMYSDMFESKQRDNGDYFVVFNKTATEELQDSVKQAHGDDMPNDFIFSTYADLMQKVTEYELDSSEALEDMRHEIVDGSVDIYTHDLTKWLASDTKNVDYLGQVVDEHTGTCNGGWEVLALAQYKAIDEVMEYVVNLLSKEDK